MLSAYLRTEAAIASACARPGSSLSGKMTTRRPAKNALYSSFHFPAPSKLQVAAIGRPALIEREFPVATERRGVFGHSMGGHGALVTALRDPDRWHSVSAFAPICNPVAVPWGQKALPRYLGADPAAWAEWDASLLMRRRAYPGPILVDQGLADQFLETQLRPDALEAAAAASGQALNLRRHADYDHSYWFIQSFMGDHLAHHAGQLLG